MQNNIFLHTLREASYGGKNRNFKIFQNIKSLYLEIQVVLKFGKERMKITLILFVYVIFSSKWSLKKPIFDQKGGKNSKFQRIQKSTSKYFRNTCCVQIWWRSGENDGRKVIGCLQHQQQRQRQTFHTP